MTILQNLLNRVKYSTEYKTTYCSRGNHYENKTWRKGCRNYSREQ